MNSDRLTRKLETAEEENILLKESNTQVEIKNLLPFLLCLLPSLSVLSHPCFCLSFFLQLRQQVEGWEERVTELEEEMRRCEVVSSGTMEDVATKDERITVLVAHFKVLHCYFGCRAFGFGVSNHSAHPGYCEPAGLESKQLCFSSRP